MDARKTPSYVISDADAELIAQHMADKLVSRLTDEETVRKIATVWSAQVDQHIGKSVRRVLWLVICAVALFVAMRTDAIVAWLKSHS